MEMLSSWGKVILGLPYGCNGNKLKNQYLPFLFTASSRVLWGRQTAWDGGELGSTKPGWSESKWWVCRFLRPALLTQGSMGVLQHMCTVRAPTHRRCVFELYGVCLWTCNRVCVLRKLWCSHHPSMFLESLMVHCSCVPKGWRLSVASAHLSLRQDVRTGNRHLFYDPGPPWMRKEHLLQTLGCTHLKELAKSSGCCIPLLFPRLQVPRKASWDLPTILRYPRVLPRHPLPDLIRLHFNCGQCWEQKGWQRGRDWYLSLAFVPRSQRKEPLNLQHKRTSSFLSPSYSKNKTKTNKKSKLSLALPKPSPKERSTGQESAAQTASTGPSHPSTGPGGPAKPSPSLLPLGGTSQGRDMPQILQKHFLPN